jgi:hypothetical protein
MTPPVPYTEGMVITATALDSEGRELFRLEGSPIRPNADGILRPMLGPPWWAPGGQGQVSSGSIAEASRGPRPGRRPRVLTGECG